jgi:MFS family permease
MVAVLVQAFGHPSGSSFPAGYLADNFDRRKVMLIAQGFMFVVSITSWR